MPPSGSKQMSDSMYLQEERSNCDQSPSYVDPLIADANSRKELHGVNILRSSKEEGAHIVGVDITDIARIKHTVDKIWQKAQFRSYPDMGCANPENSDVIPCESSAKNSDKIHDDENPNDADTNASDASHQSRNKTSGERLVSTPITVEKLVWAYMESSCKKELSDIKTQHNVKITAARTENPSDVLLTFHGSSDETKRGVDAFVRLHGEVDNLTKTAYVDAKVDLDSMLLETLTKKYEVLIRKVDVHKYGVIGFIGKQKQTVKLYQAKEKLDEIARLLHDTDGSTKDGISVSLDFCVGLQTARGTRILVYYADITKLSVQVIVNAANEYLQHGGGVAYAIAKAAGPKLTQESKDYITQNGLVPVSTFAQTTAGNLAVGSVLHAVGPQWPTTQYATCEEEKRAQNHCLKILTKTFSNIFRFAYNENVPSIAVPAISSGK